MASTRSGVLCVGSIVVDLAKVIDAYPDQERLTLIRPVTVNTGVQTLTRTVARPLLIAPFPHELDRTVAHVKPTGLVRAH